MKKEKEKKAQIHFHFDRGSETYFHFNRWSSIYLRFSQGSEIYFGFYRRSRRRHIFDFDRGPTPATPTLPPGRPCWEFSNYGLTLQLFDLYKYIIRGHGQTPRGGQQKGRIRPQNYFAKNSIFGRFTLKEIVYFLRVLVRQSKWP